MEPNGTKVNATIFVCISCRRAREGAGEGEAFETPGPRLVADIAAHLAAQGTEDVLVEPVECLAVCKRPCTLALAADGKWTYVIGDLDADLHAGEIVAAARAYAATDNGIVPWRERPQTFRKGVISRVPPIGFKQPAPTPPPSPETT